VLVSKPVRKRSRRPHRRGATAKVYAIEAVGAGLVKIGRANNVYERLFGLQTASGYPLRIINVVAGGSKTETELHRLFAEHRVRGEWFLLEPIRAAIEALQTLPVAVWGRRCQHCAAPIWGRSSLCKPCGYRSISDAASARAAAAGTPRRRCAVCDRGISRDCKHCPQCTAARPSRPGSPHSGVRYSCVACGGRVSAAASKHCFPCELKRRAASRSPCLDCGGRTSHLGVKRCHQCEWKRRGYKVVDPSAPKPRCLDCNTLIKPRSKRCLPCSNKNIARAWRQRAAQASEARALQIVLR